MTTEAKSLKDWLALEAVPVPVEHRGFSFTVRAYPERATDALTNEASAVATDENSIAKGEWHVIKALVESWTLEDEFGEGTVISMSRGLRRAIIRAVYQEAADPTQAVSVETSSSSSSQTATTDAAPAGT